MAMSDSSLLTLRVTPETKSKLARLASWTHRTQAEVVDEALADHLDRELMTLEAIERGRTEVRAGHGLSTEDVFQAVDKSIAEAEARRTGK